MYQAIKSVEVTVGSYRCRKKKIPSLGSSSSVFYRLKPVLYCSIRELLLHAHCGYLMLVMGGNGGQI